MELHNKFYLLFAVSISGAQQSWAKFGEKCANSALYSVGNAVEISSTHFYFTNITTAQTACLVVGSAALNATIASIFHFLVPQTLVFGLLAGFTVTLVTFVMQMVFKGRNDSFKPFAFEQKWTKILGDSTILGCCAFISFAATLLSVKVFIGLSVGALALFLTYHRAVFNFKTVLYVIIFRSIQIGLLASNLNPALFALGIFLLQGYDILNSIKQKRKNNS